MNCPFKEEPTELPAEPSEEGVDYEESGGGEEGISDVVWYKPINIQNKTIFTKSVQIWTFH